MHNKLAKLKPPEPTYYYDIFDQVNSYMWNKNPDLGYWWS